MAGSGDRPAREAAAHDWQRWQKTVMRASIAWVPGEPGAAAAAGLALAAVDQQLELEVARSPVPVR